MVCKGSGVWVWWLTLILKRCEIKHMHKCVYSDNLSPRSHSKVISRIVMHAKYISDSVYNMTAMKEFSTIRHHSIILLGTGMLYHKQWRVNIWFNLHLMLKCRTIFTAHLATCKGKATVIQHQNQGNYHTYMTIPVISQTTHPHLSLWKWKIYVYNINIVLKSFRMCIV